MIGDIKAPSSTIDFEAMKRTFGDSQEQFKYLEEMLKEEDKKHRDTLKHSTYIPITHNKGTMGILFNGCILWIYEDGRWGFEADSTGG